MSATGPAGLGLASDPGDALANALPELAKLFCKQAGVGYHAANKILLKELKKYPKDVPLTLYFRVNRAPMSLEDRSLGCIMGFEPHGAIIGTFEPNVLSTPQVEYVAVRAVGLGPPIPHFPGVSLRIDPPEKQVPLGETAYYSSLTASFSVNGRVHEMEMRPNDAIWESSDDQAVAPIPATPPGTGLVMTPAGGAQAQGFSTHRTGRYSVIASLPSGASTYATLEVMPNEELRAYWMVRHHAAADDCRMCLSGVLQVRFDAEGKAADGKFDTECIQISCTGLPLHTLCPPPAAQKSQMSGDLLNIQADVDARILKADMKSRAAGANELGNLTGDYQRIGNARPYEYLGSGRIQLPWMENGAIVGWAQGTWHSNTPLKCLRY